jgi:hypothetical protein
MLRHAFATPERKHAHSCGYHAFLSVALARSARSNDAPASGVPLIKFGETKMQARTFHLLAIALGTALLSPLVLAQDQSTAATSQSSTSGQMTAPPTSSTSTTSASGANAKFGKLDTNADGRISAAEANADKKLSGGFASIDADHDGYLSQSEYTTGAATMGSSDNTGATMGNADWSDDSSKDSDSDSKDQSTDSKDDAKPTTP